MLKNDKKLKKAYKNNWVSIVLLIIFLAFSVVFISPDTEGLRSEYHSIELRKVTAKNDNMERIDYINPDGEIVIAADQGYATMIITLTDKGKLEQYYDEHGNPISRYAGYYAVLREYDDRGNNTRNTYLDASNNPVMVSGGYAIEEREYNENRQVILISYYDAASNPMITSSYGFGRKNEYDENGKNTKTTFVDTSG